MRVIIMFVVMMLCMGEMLVPGAATPLTVLVGINNVDNPAVRKQRMRRDRRPKHYQHSRNNLAEQTHSPSYKPLPRC